MLAKSMPSLKQLSAAPAAALTRLYATSAQKKPTPPPDTKSSSQSSPPADKPAAAEATKAGEKPNLRLVDYVSRKDLEMQRKVVMDMVTKSEVKFYDPPYLAREAPFPVYAELNINLKGYDFTVLESYHNFIARLCRALDVDVKDIYAMPARSYKVKTYRPFSSNLDKEYSLKMYHRVVRIKNLKSTTAPLLFEAIQLNLPEGVKLSVGEPTVEEENFRYVPDHELKGLKEQLEELTRSSSPPPATSPQPTPSASPAKK